MLDFEFDVAFYNKPDGSEPAQEFLDELDDKMFAKMLRSIHVIKAGGTLVREPYSKHLDDGIFEARAQVGSNLSRVLYFFYDGHRIVLTHGFIKKTQKTPPSEISRAKRYRNEYRSRKGEQR